jgi:hypothetical protein
MSRLTFGERPPEPLKPPAKVPPIDWPALVEQLLEHKGVWARLDHQYASDSTAASAVRAAAKRYGMEYRTSRAERDEEGRLGLYVRITAESLADLKRSARMAERMERLRKRRARRRRPGPEEPAPARTRANALLAAIGAALTDPDPDDLTHEEDFDGETSE